MAKGLALECARHHQQAKDCVVAVFSSEVSGDGLFTISDCHYKEAVLMAAACTL